MAQSGKKNLVLVLKWLKSQEGGVELAS